MQKDFDVWNQLKKKLNDTSRILFFHPREIWWCSLGINIGEETNGKNNNFERPIIILKVYNKKTLLIFPLTTKNKEDNFHYKIKTKQKTVWAKITQPRVISSKRLLRKIDTLDENTFNYLKQTWKDSI